MAIEDRSSILYVVASTNVGIGGPASSVSGLAGVVSSMGVSATVASLDYPKHGSRQEVRNCRELSLPVTFLGRVLRGWSPTLRSFIFAEARQADLIHSHALWMVPGIYARQAALRFEKPLVISPRGMLDPWSLSRSRFKKRIASWAYENRNLAAARMFHATSEAEAESIRRYGLKQPIVVLPNGVDLPAEAPSPSRAILEERFPALRGFRWLLFFGRLDPKKGLDLLLDLWRELGPVRPTWHLVVAGPDLEGFGARLVRQVAADERLRERVTFTGMLEGEEKREALSGSDLFVLPTLGENFGIAVAEALAHGTPVLTTTAAPWEALVERDCGWWVAPGSDAVREALAMALSLPPEELSRRGARGRELVRERFGWDSIGARWVEAYRWLLSGGDAPAEVRLD